MRQEGDRGGWPRHGRIAYPAPSCEARVRGMVHFSEDDNFGYLDLGTESIRNVALITLDMQPSETPPPPPSPAPRTGGNSGAR